MRGKAGSPALVAVRDRLRTHMVTGAFVVSGVTMLCIAVFTLIGWNVWLSRAASEIAASKTVENLAHLASHDAGAHVAAVDAFLRGLIAAFPPTGEARLSPAQFEVMSSLAGAIDRLGSVVIVDAEGRPVQTIASDDIAPTTIATGFATAPWFVEAVREPDRLAVGAPTTGLHGGASVLPVALASRDPAGVRAVVMAELRIDALEQSLAGVDLGSNGVVWLLWGKETIVFRMPSTDGTGDTGRIVAGSPNAHHYLGQTQGTYRGRSAIDGIERLYAFQALHGVPLILAVGIGVEDFADWQRQAAVSLAMAGVLCSVMIGIALLLRREIARRNATEQELWLRSETDPLTGLANRRRFERVIEVEMRRARRNRMPTSVLMIDVDRFKLTNDRFGHASGDRVLRIVAAELTAAIRRPADLAARVGGDEFAVLLPETEAGGAERVAESARRSIEAGDFPEAGAVTITIGIATFASTAVGSPTDLIAAADRALYAAKEAGRNRTGHWTGDDL